MKSDDRKPLVDEILATRELDELRAATLDQGLAAVRGRRQRRQLRRAAAVMVCLAGVAAVALVVLFESAAPGRDNLLTGDPPRRPVAPFAEVASGNTAADVSRLSDDELLALFPNRPVALIGPAGRQKLVFLDQLRAGSSP